MATKKPVVKPEATTKPKAKSTLTGADITGKKYNTQIKEEAAKIKLKTQMGEKLTAYEKSVTAAQAAIQRMNPQPKATPKPKKRTVSPSKMTPKQKADYLKNPNRYDPLG